MWKQYITPATLDEALEQLAAHAGEARIVAGATDLIIEYELGMRAGVTTLIDITRIPGLDEVSREEDGALRLGAMVTHNRCAASDLIRSEAYALARASWEVGSPLIRNRATVAGNLITASPANDTIPPLMALDAQLVLRSVRGERRVVLREFYTGVRKTVIEPDEILVAIRVPVRPNRRSAFYKLGLRRAQAISVVNAAVALVFDGSEVTEAVITLGSVAPTVVRAPEAEARLIGEALSEEIIQEAGALAMLAAQPIDDLRSSADYRREMTRISVVRALRTLLSEGQADPFPEEPVTLGGAKGAVAAALPVSVQHDGAEPIVTRINGVEYRFSSGHDKTLLRLIREEAGLTGTKEGCAEGECGACTVYLDGAAVLACLVPAPRAHGAEIVTIEGLSGEGSLHPVQEAFIEEGAVQCGYCTPGFVMSGAKLLEEKPHPQREEIAQAISGNLCRCTGYYKIIRAIERAGEDAAA